MLTRKMCLAVAACVLAGCSGDSGEATATADNPQAALDVAKKLQGPIETKSAAKGKAPASSKPH